MRWDTLGQLVARADIQAGSRPLVVEQTGGALTGMVLQRLGGQGVCFHAYEGAGAPVGNARRAVRKEWVRDTLRTFPVTWVAGALERRRRVNAREYAYVRALIASRHGAAGAAEEKAKNEEGAKEEEEEAKEDASKPAAKRRRIPPAERAGGGVEEEEEGEMDATGSGNADAGGVTAAGEAPESGSGEGEGGEEGESDGEDEPYRGEEEALAELRNAMRSQNEREMSDEARSALKGRRRTALEWGLAHGATKCEMPPHGLAAPLPGPSWPHRFHCAAQPRRVRADGCDARSAVHVAPRAARGDHRCVHAVCGGTRRGPAYPRVPRWMDCSPPRWRATRPSWTRNSGSRKASWALT